MFSSTKSPPTSPAVPAIDGGFTSFTGGTTSVVVPSDVTSITALVIGGSGGGGGASTTATIGAAGGGGGALSYSTIAVTPNETLTVTRGTGGARGTVASINGSAGGDSYIARSGTNLILAKGGAGGLGSTSGSTANTGGGAGGDAASGIGDVKNSGGKGGDRYSTTLSGGGGGVAGYSGTGGAGGTSASAATDGSGGGGGGGSPYNTTITGSGGGTLFYGEGSNGVAGIASAGGLYNGGLGSSLGGSHEFGNGFGFSVQGGGAGGIKNSGVGDDGGTGSDGVIRILWGSNKSFPSTNVGTNTISLFASVTSSTDTITVPAGVRPGDYIILLDYADDSSAVPASTRPSGFGSIFSATNATTFTRVNYSDRVILSESYAGTVLTGMTGNTAIQKFLLVFRGTAGYCEFIDDNTNSQLETTSAPTTQTITLSSLDPYTDGIPISFAFFKGSSGITSTSQLTFSGATFIQGTSNIYYCGYKIYSQATTSVSDSISMQDRGTNTMCSFAVRGF